MSSSSNPFVEGVRFYTKAVITYEFGFPENATVCKFCPFCYTTPMDAARCRITGEFVLRPATERGLSCPAEIKEEA